MSETASWIGAEAQLPAVYEANQRKVRKGFWPKFRRVAARLPFAQDLAAAWFCAVDPATPLRVRATLFGALAYFVLPFDVVPDILAVVGFTDDASLLFAALTVVAAGIKPEHRKQAAEALATLDG
ncbi:YkvA family protein [Microbaculum marinum]|uniref:YkvA family protein n=1 Tax=Microbaculum marinum TaxID=1764581 RepID=A0AAW9S0W7_9HYPH